MCPGVAAVKDLYSVLNLKPTADLNEVRAAYRRAALFSHPDKGGTAQAFHVVKFAFEVLSCSASRKIYDSTYSRQTARLHCSAPATSAQAEYIPPTVESVQMDMGTRRPLKRSKPHSYREPPQADLKRRRCFDPTVRTGKSHYFFSRTPMRLKQVITLDAALERLRIVLQSMAAPRRSAALQMVDPRVAGLLFDFMKKQKRARHVLSHADATARWSPCVMKLKHRIHMCGFSGVHTLKNNGGTRYRTQLVIRGLRLYTLAKCYEDAIDHHIVLAHMRDAIATASLSDSSLWTNPTKLLGILETALDENGASEQKINLHAFIYMKAAPWLHQSTPITSPILQLREAVSVYTQLLSAQSVSWDRLRAEWVSLLLHMRKGRAQATQARTLGEAEAIADNARHFALAKQLKHVEHGVKCAVRHEKARAAALKRDAMRQHREKWRQRWIRRNDLTMEDILCGGNVQV